MWLEAFTARMVSPVKPVAHSWCVLPLSGSRFPLDQHCRSLTGQLHTTDRKHIKFLSLSHVHLVVWAGFTRLCVVFVWTHLLRHHLHSPADTQKETSVKCAGSSDNTLTWRFWLHMKPFGGCFSENWSHWLILSLLCSSIWEQTFKNVILLILLMCW